MSIDGPTPHRLGYTLSRRRFLKVTASAAGGSLLQPLARAAPESELRMPRGRPPSRVVQVQSRQVVDGPVVHAALASEMLQKALTSLTGTSTIGQAWQSILKPDDVIGLKFNLSGQEVIGTTSTLADVLIGSIVQAGWRSAQIVCIEAPDGTEARHGTTPAHQGYDSSPTDFGSGADQYASVLRQVTALIDVPYLKTHNIAQMTCTLKNLSHGLIKHPARYHRNGCSPFVADIVSAPPIRSKLRLCLVDAFRVVYARGPDATTETISDEGILLASFDPVATDTVGLARLNDIRRRFQLGPIARSGSEVGYLAEAHRRGLGIALWHGIDLIQTEP